MRGSGSPGVGPPSQRRPVEPGSALQGSPPASVPCAADDGASAETPQGGTRRERERERKRERERGREGERERKKEGHSEHMQVRK